MTWVEIAFSGAITVLLIPVVIYVVRYYWDRRRWRAFERRVRKWASAEQVLKEDLTDEDWHALAATLLSEAGFEPAKAWGLIELAVWFAKGLASLEVRGRI